MITCPWCGTSYVEFQPNCRNCGGSLPPPVGSALSLAEDRPPAPPPAPRDVPRHYAWRVLSTDSGGIVGGILAFIGAIFVVVGIPLAALGVGLLIGLPFVGLGITFLAVGLALLAARYQSAQQTVEVLKRGQATLGRIVDVQENFHVQVNGRYPWTIIYRFPLAGREYEGKVTTLSQPTLKQQPGKAVYVLYLPADPARNTIYPNPYGYLAI